MKDINLPYSVSYWNKTLSFVYISIMPNFSTVSVGFFSRSCWPNLSVYYMAVVIPSYALHMVVFKFFLLVFDRSNNCSFYLGTHGYILLFVTMNV